MADATSRLRLVVDSTGVDRAGRKLKDLRRNARDAETAAARLKNAFAGLAGVLGAAFSVREITKAVDSYRQIENQLRLVTSSTKQLKTAQEGVLAVANATGASLDTTARLYANLERFAGQFLKTQQDTLDLTLAINQAALVSGASVQESSNAIRQLTQGIPGGVLRAEEFNSVIENLPRLGQAIADGLGIGIGELRKQVNEGLVTSEKLVTAIQSQFGTLQEEALKSSRTIAQAMQSLGNILTVELGQRFSGVQDVAVKALQFIGENLEKIIPLAEGAAVALLTLGSVFAASSALAAAPAILAAIVSPLGLLTLAIAGLVAFRDDIAEWAFGVSDASTVVQAAVDVLKPKFVGLFETIKSVAVASLDILKKFGLDVKELFQALAGVIQQYFDVINEAISRVQIATKTNELEKLAKRQEELTKRLKANLSDPFQDASLQDGTKAIREELDAVNASISKTSEELNGLLNPSGGLFEGIKDTFGEIATRAQEIEAAKLADPFEEANESAEKLKKTTKGVSDEIKKLNAGVSSAFLDIKFDEKLGLFGGLDLGRLPQAARDQAFNDFERAFDELEIILAKQADLTEADRAAFIGKLASAYDDFLKDYNDANAEHISGIQRALRDGVPKLEIAAEGLNIGTEIFDSLTDAIRSFKDGANKSFEAIAGTVGRIGQNIGNSLKRAGQFVGGSFGGILGKAGQVAGFVGEAASFVSSFVGFFKSIFGKASDNAAGGGVNFKSFAAENLFNKGDQNVGARDELLSATGQLGKLLTQLTGSNLTGSGISIQVGSRNGTRIISAAGGDVTTPVGNAEAATAEIFRQLAVSLRGGEAALVNLTKAAANSKANIDEVVDVLGALSEIAKSGEPPISKYGEALKKLDALLSQVANSAAVRAQAVALLRTSFEDDVANAIEEIKDPAVAGFRELARNLATVLNDATALGVDTSAGSPVMELIGLQISQFFEQAAQGGEDITALTARLSELGQVLTDLGIDANVAAQALSKALATQRAAFDDDVLNQISGFLTGPLDQLEKLLETQRKRIEQAEALGADLTQVERLSALELRQFFQGLSDSALDEVRDFLGLFQEAADSVVRNLDLSRQDLRARADQFGDFAQQFASLATDFRERFVAASPRECIDILRGRASELLGQIGQGNESAAQALPQVLNQLVENARQSFGNTKQFQEVLDFALSTLGQAESSALGVQSEAERQIAALDESNDLLTDIRDILQSSQAFNALLQSAAGGGVASAGELLALIQSGAGLTMNAANDNAATLSITSLIAQSLSPVFTPLVSSIDNFTQSMSQMPYLQRLEIDATDRVAAAVEDQTVRLEDKLDRIEVIQKQALLALAG